MTVRHAPRRSFLALAALSLVLLGGNAAASSTSAKRIVYVSGSTLATVAANGTGTTSLGVTGLNPSSSSDGTTIVYDNGTTLRKVDASGANDGALCAGTDPAISPNGSKIAYVAAGTVTVATIAGPCGSSVSVGAGSDPAWSPDSQQVAFVDAVGDIAVAPATGGAAQKLGTTAAAESDPAWSPDGTKIAYVSGGELFVMGADGGSRQQLTSNAVGESSPSWSPSGDELVYAAGGSLWAIPSGGGSPRQLADATSASSPDWGLAVANLTPPGIVLDPTAGGVVADGTQLSADLGSWTSMSGITGFAFQWTRCGSAGTGCVAISGATSGTYTVTSTDIGSRIRVVVVASTPDGSAPGTSAATDVVASAAPRNVTPPSVTGTPILGTTLTAQTGTWTGSNIVYTYQWLRCDLAGGNCAAIGAESSQNVYTPVSADVGKTLKVRVKGTNADGSATADSIASPPVTSNIPANSELPQIAESTSTAGATVTSFTATTGTWTGAGTITYKYQWRRCDSGGANCKDVAGATSSFYTSSSADVGGKLRVAVTATNLYGSATAVSEPTALLAGAAPANTVRPSISGTERAGSSLFVGTGTWTGTLPLTYTYQWLRCTSSGTGCASIAGATSPSYIATGADVGSTIAASVTARNVAGSATVTSAPTDVIEAGTTTAAATRPTSTQAPSIKGTLAKGKTLSAVVGAWAGTTPMTYSYQWQRCAKTGTACTPIAHASSATYLLVAADVGKRIRLAVTAGNAAGSTVATSGITALVRATAPAAVRIVNGTRKADRLVGTAAAERIDGKAGDDRIDGRGGKDVLVGGTGNDTILAADGIAETVDCGKGKDRAVVDRTDRVRGCEQVTRKGAKKPKATKQQATRR